LDILSRRYGNMTNRYVCSILDEIRDLDKTKRYDRLIGMIEEVQTAVNRMESKLHDYSEKKYTIRLRTKKLKQKIKDLKAERNGCSCG
jgi:chromosome segregation ATPase